jgi:hypothetical protein
MRAPDRTTGAAGVAAVLAAAFLLACARDDGDSEPADAGVDPAPTAARGAPGRRADDPPHAQRFRVDELRRDRDAPRHPSDGGGTATVSGDVEIQATALGRWTIRYEAGPEGVAAGGSVRVLIPPFWRWDTGQVERPDARGFVTASTDAEGVTLETSVPDGYTILVDVRGRALRAGEHVDVTFGAGEARARTDMYAERESPFHVTVDGDGDGIGGVIADSPTIRIVAGPPARLLVWLPSTAHPGDEVEARLALVDRYGNAGVEFAGAIELLGISEGLEAPERIELAADAGGVAVLRARVASEGVHRLLARAVPETPPPGAPDDFEGWFGESNPLEANERAPRILWADLHGHTNLTDGTGTPEDFFRYARDVAALDVVALTDHDHWGMRKLDAHPAMWQRIVDATREANSEGLLTILGYEWTSWIHGHRHVLYFQDEGPMLSSIDERYESPLDLWAALRAADARALTFAHHSAGGPIATNWDIPPDPDFEPVTEVSSVHGASEALDDAEVRIYSPVEGNFVRDVLDRGYRLGFVGSGDSHDGHPGLPHLTAPNGGLAAILSEDRTQEGVLAALRERRCYATNGPRIVLRAALGSARMGATLAAPPAGADPLLLFMHAIGTRPLERIDVVRSGAVVESIPCDGAYDFSTAVDVAELAAGEYVYVRVHQAERGRAWSSPFFVE